MSFHSGSRVAGCAALCVTLLAFTPPALAGWSNSAVLVHATTAHCPQISVASDGAHGAIVVWEEDDASRNGPLYARHLLASGDVDPAWPATASVCPTITARQALGSVADGLGGAYVWWMVDANLFLTRIGPDGQRAPGWPTTGRNLGWLSAATQRPTAFSDGAHGIYVGWIEGDYTLGVLPRAFAVHLGPGNAGAAGWPDFPREMPTPNVDNDWVDAAAFAPAPGGGLWFLEGYSFWFSDVSSAGEWRLSRLDAGGQPVAGWPADGLSLATFHGEKLIGDLYFDHVPVAAMLGGVASDGADGAYVCRSDLTHGTALYASEAVLHHFDGSGALAAGWPAAGVRPGISSTGTAMLESADLSVRAIADGAGGVIAGYPFFYDHAIVSTFVGYGPGATRTGFQAGVNIASAIEYFAQDGGFYLSSCHGTGPYGAMDQHAYIRAGAPGTGYYVEHPEPVTTWYGDAGIAATGDGGAIFAWSQERESFGIYAIRLGGNGLVTGVTPGTVATNPWTLRFEPGAGVRAFADFATAGRARWALYDVSGRAVASGVLETTAGSHAWTLEGTASLRAGLYFAKLTQGGHVRDARVVVTN